MAILNSLGIIILASAIIYYAGKYFSEASSGLGDHLHLPRSVKGATFDAISSSLPELLVALYSVIFFKQFEVGIGTIAGSALFNLLIIPGICVLVAPKVFTVSKKVISREAIFYIVSVIALIIAVASSLIWGLLIPIIFLGMYILYVFILVKDVKHHKKNFEKKIVEGSAWVKGIIITITVLIIGIATYFLTEHAILFSELIGVHPFIIAFTIIAGATSVPDAVISILNAKKGDIDDATSNVFGSNIFDILVGLSIPVIIAYFLVGPTTINFQRIELLGMLLLSSIIIYVFLRKKRTLSKKKGWILLGIYGLILGYVVFLTLSGII